MKTKHKASRIAFFVLAVAFIVFQWLQKDVLSVYANLSPEALLPVIVTSLAVFLLKVAGITALVLWVQCLAGRFRKK